MRRLGAMCGLLLVSACGETAPEEVAKAQSITASVNVLQGATASTERVALFGRLADAKTALTASGQFELPALWSADTSLERFFTGDFNGDRRTDYYHIERDPRRPNNVTGATMWLSSGAGFSRVSVSSPTLSNGDYWTGDINGDGKDDLVAFNGAWLSDGAKFTWSGVWTTEPYTGGPWYVGDFNGDGKTDILRYEQGTSGAKILLSTGTSFQSAGSWTDAWYGDRGWYIGDFNGDGKDDLLRYLYGKSGADVFLSTGSSFVYSGSWTPAGMGESGWHLGDFNGDGKTDLARYLVGQTGADMWLSNGAAFVHDGDWTPAGHGEGGADSRDGIGWEEGDFNGDGKTDLLRVVPQHGVDVLLSRR